MILIRSTGAPEECLQLIRVASFLVHASLFSHQRFYILHTWSMQLFQRRESSKRDYYIISPRVIIKAIIISFEFRPRGTILTSIFAGCFCSLFTNPFPAFRASRWLRHFLPFKEPLLTLCKDESYFTLFARYSHVLQWAFCHC